MKKGFTLLELVVVIIILGVLATLGITQYGRMVEKMRTAEARAILGDIRKLVYAYWLANATIDGIPDAYWGIGSGADQIPGFGSDSCRSSHYFYYNPSPQDDHVTMYIYANRCMANGKPPQGGSHNYSIILVVTPATGVDRWITYEAP